MKISIRLIIGFGSLLFMMCFLTFLAISEVNLIDNTLSKMTDVNSKKQRYAINFRGSVHDRAIGIRDVVLSQNDNELKKQLSLIDKLDDFYQESAKSLKRDLSDNMTMTGEETSILKEINQIEVKTKIIMEKIINETQEKRMVQATTLLLDEASPAFVNWLNEINKFIDYQEALNKTATEETRSLTSGFQNRMIGLTLFALFLGTSLAYFILLRIKQSVGGEPREGEVIISRIAQGDLTGIIYTDYKNSMMDSVATMQNKLKDIVNSIAHSSTELFQRAETVTKSSESSLQLADQQNQYSASVVSALEDMSDSISSVANIVKQTEDNSRTTVELSLTGRESVQKVASEIEEISKTVSQTVNQVNLLEQTTNEIGNIVNVIRSISDQTNLLALNAAIEAARAGEAGRGFAVVADEVRQLAKRTGEATGEIENMITQVQVNTKASVEAMETTVPQVERGLVLTKEASKLLDDIQLQANSSMEKVLEVVKDTTNQVSTIENIKSSVSELDNISKNTSDAFQESVEQAKHLERLSAKLRSDIDYFSI